MKTYNVLVFPSGTEIANEVLNALKYNKYFNAKLVSSEKSSFSDFRTQEVHLLPYVNETSFLDELNKLIKTEEIHFIIPAHDDVALALSQIENIIDVGVIGQSKAVNEIVRFKDITYSFFKDSLPIANIYENEKELVFPVFVKPKRGQGAQDSFLIKKRQEFTHFKEKYAIDDFVLMEYLDGAEYTIDCFSNKGSLLYAGARTREKMIRGISVRSTLVRDECLIEQFQKYAEIISLKLQLHGLWFYQMKLSEHGTLKLLEISSRVSGTMMLNRSRGVNFVELALFQKLAYPVEVVFNDIDISLGRSLVAKYKTIVEYDELFVDFDDTLFLEERNINTDVIKLIFQAKNRQKRVYLITKNKKNNLTKTLHYFGINHIFDDIFHLDETEKKLNYMKKKSLLIDDSFKERKEVIQAGLLAFGTDAIDALII